MDGRRSVWNALRVAAALAVLAVLVLRLGTQPFTRAVDRLTVSSVITAVAITAVSTVCSAWRWSWTARRLGLSLRVRSAVPAYYRSQFLNVTLPGGVLGDVHRAVRHGADESALRGAARAVAWERALGQLGLVAVAALAMIALPSVMRGAAAWALGMLLVAATVALLMRFGRRRGPGGRFRTTLLADVHRLSGGRLWFPLLLSVVAATGHLLVLLTAVRAAGVDVSLVRAVPLLLAVLVGSSLPLSFAGWGPREGVAAWVFGAAGLGAADGVTVAAAYGVLAFVSVLPGALLVLLDGLPGRPRARHA